MSITDAYGKMLEVVNNKFPNWTGFDDPRFIEEETGYKNEASKKAKEILDKNVLQELLTENKFDDILKRIEKVGQSTNLLYLSTPRTGDLGIIYQDNLNKKEFCEIFFNLIYGVDSLKKRFTDYIEFVKTNNLPNRFTFPTYFLFLLYPETEIIIKPTIINKFGNYINPKHFNISKPYFPSYEMIKKIAFELKEKLQEYGAKDMIDVQSFIWVAVKSGVENNDEKKLEKYLKEFEINSDKYLKDNDYVTKYYNFFQDFIKKENLEKAEWKDFQEMGNHIHSFNSMAIAKGNALGKPNHPIEHYRNSFLYLVYGDDSIEVRIRNFCENEKYSLKYFGNSTISEIIGYMLADNFIFMNSRDLFSLKFLGIEPGYNRGDKFVDKLLKFNEAVKPIAKQYEKIIGRKTDLPINLEVDQFFSYLYETYSKDGPIEKPQYWLLAAGEDAKHWQDFQNNNIIAVGWDKIGDLNQFTSKNEIEKELSKLYKSDKKPVMNSKCLFDFKNNIKIGDLVFIKQGAKKILGLAEIKSDYYYDTDREYFQKCRKVEWIKTGEWENQEKFALKTLTNISKYTEMVDDLKKLIEAEPPPQTTNFWWLNANPKIWTFRDMNVGAINDYKSFTDKGTKARIFKNFQNVQVKDKILGYITSPENIVDGICEVLDIFKENNEIVKFEFKKIEEFKKPVTWNELKSNNELLNCEPLKNNQGSLFKLTKEEYDIIMEMIYIKNLPVPENEKYSNDDALTELFIEQSELEGIISTLKYKKNIILQGAPGVGKTFIAKRIAYLMMGEKDESRVQMIQFHQSYSYEDFIQGYRPTDNGGFEIKNGVFYEFCKKAQWNPDKDYFFIIDEINRGNLSKIFGELMMLIEKDKRGKNFAIPLTYSKNEDEIFYLPKNLYFIGTMNTADRSLAMVDYALRRRFGFKTLEPAFDKPKFKKFLYNCNVTEDIVEMIIDKMISLNEKIAIDNKNLGMGYRIGHSFFCPGKDIVPDWRWYEEVVKSEIAPLLREYWFDSIELVDDEIKKLIQI